ncbi:carbonic anhydrase [Synechococcales cyanobacterium C]|uniref:Carbonic anhydrase n=1 Tax=Petrachloros mirabilis ULC683 TaxID=2781853 RepID=A0A8K1ZXP4_9CYAN|nr:carbonic anhydrase [Petrachloros mirabilis]NCJ05998.1 carbonic anhydrase [Petrachloros mirabilis ULC683]
MKKLIQGLREFHDTYVPTHRELLDQLAHGQKPRVLFITCSDSRIDPNLLTHTEIGELFVIRNAGNMIPPYRATNGGEGAAVEYAIAALGIEHIIVCGHSHCGAMKGLMKLNQLQEGMPLVFDWLKHTEATRRLVAENYPDAQGEELLEILVAENVLTQIENLKTYPIIHSRLYKRTLHIYAWIYYIETGEVWAYDPVTHSYVPPQSQLSDSEGWSESEPSLGTPAIACELPQHAGLSQTAVSQQAIPTAASTSRPVRKSSSTSSQVGIVAPWLSPQQAERIYRGNH